MSRSLNGFLCLFINLLALVITGFFMHLLYANQMLHFQWTAGKRSNDGEPKEITPAVIHWSRGRSDDRRMLRIYEWVWNGSQWDELTKKFHVCLATQSSVDRLHSIAEVSEKWLGPISLAVYIQIADEWIALNLFVMYMQRCSAIFAQTVSIHVAVPVTYEPKNNDNVRLADFPLWSTHPCGQPLEFLGIVMKNIVATEVDPNFLYPQNHMRNVARKTCGTPWVFLTDIDIIPRPNSCQMLQEFFDSRASNCSKCAFVVPTFELSTAARYPESKQDLIKYGVKGLARPFHLEIYANGHLATNYSKWNHTNLKEGPIKISHSIGSNDLLSLGASRTFRPDIIPAHEERFIGYGFTRSSQVLEALELGWKFKVLTPIFAIHWGLQEPKNASNPVEVSREKNDRISQTWNSRFIYKDFVAELQARKAIAWARKKKGKEKRDGPKKVF